jgi:branched-subunit amino acid transport protein
MTAFGILVAAGVASWLLRVLFITLVPASRLPGGFRDALEHLGVAVPAALVATALAKHAASGGLLASAPAGLALLASAVVARHRRNVSLIVATGILLYWALGGVWRLVGWAG